MNWTVQCQCGNAASCDGNTLFARCGCGLVYTRSRAEEPTKEEDCEEMNKPDCIEQGLGAIAKAQECLGKIKVLLDDGVVVTPEELIVALQKRLYRLTLRTEALEKQQEQHWDLLCDVSNAQTKHIIGHSVQGKEIQERIKALEESYEHLLFGDIRGLQQVAFDLRNDLGERDAQVEHLKRSFEQHTHCQEEMKRLKALEERLSALGEQVADSCGEIGGVKGRVFKLEEREVRGMICTYRCLKCGNFFTIEGNEETEEQARLWSQDPRAASHCPSCRNKQVADSCPDDRQDTEPALLNERTKVNWRRNCIEVDATDCHINSVTVNGQRFVPEVEEKSESLSAGALLDGVFRKYNCTRCSMPCLTRYPSTTVCGEFVPKESDAD